MRETVVFDDVMTSRAKDGQVEITLTSRKEIVGRVRCSVFTASKVKRTFNEVLCTTWRPNTSGPRS